MSKITRKIEIIPDIKGLTHDESNKKCYGAFYTFDKNLYKVANLLVSQLYGLDNLLSLMRLQNDEYVKCQSKLSLKSTTDAEKENLKKRIVYTNLKVYHFLIKKCTTPNRLRRYA